MGSGALARRETLAVFCNHARRCSASALRYWYGGAGIFCSNARAGRWSQLKTKAISRQSVWFFWAVNSSKQLAGLVSRVQYTH
jgi:hypothetical protein